MKRVIAPAALAELNDAAAFYTASANLELGLAFLAEFEHGVNAILVNPKVGALIPRYAAALSAAPVPLQHHLPNQHRRAAGNCCCASAEAPGLLGRPQVSTSGHRHKPPNRPIRPTVQQRRFAPPLPGR